MLDRDPALAPPPVLDLDPGLSGLSFWPPGLLFDCEVPGFLAPLSDLPFPLLLFTYKKNMQGSEKMISCL